MADNQAIAKFIARVIVAVRQPNRRIRRSFNGIGYRSQLNGVSLVAAAENQTVETAGAGIVDIEELLSAGGGCQLHHITITALAAIENATIGPVGDFESVGGIKTG